GLAGRLITSCLADRTFYWLKEKGAVDNPDERIAEDVKTFTATALSFTLIVLNGTFTVLAFAGVLWTISRLLFAVAVGYALLGSLMTIFPGARPGSTQLPAARSRGQFPVSSDPAPGARRFNRPDALGATANRPAAAPPRRPRGQLPAHHVGQPQPGVVYDRLQLPDPDSSDPDCGPALHPRRGRVRGGDTIGDGLRPTSGGLLANRQPVSVPLLVCRRHGPAGRARGSRRASE